MSAVGTSDGRQVLEIPRAKLVPDPDQPRKAFDDAGLAALATSLRRGVRVPLLVRPIADGKYLIVDGERRWRAAKLAALDTLPVIVLPRDLPEDELRLDQVTVNNLREQLTTMEVARMLADLRKRHFATVNDLAAALDKRGLPAMTPDQIQQAIDLTEMPGWLQAMVDARVVEASEAIKLRVIEPWPAVMAVAKDVLEQDLKWRGRITANDIRGAIHRAASHGGVEIRTDSWFSKAAHFNPKTVCRGCEQKLVIGGERFCMAPEEFERKNAEAKAAGLLPGGKKPPKKAPLEPGSAAAEHLEAQKAAGREASLETKAREYLHAYLVHRISEQMRTEIDIAEELLIWWAMERPGQYAAGPHARAGRHDGAKAARVRGLEDLFTAGLPNGLAGLHLDDAKLEAAVQVARELYWRETQVICHQIWGKDVATVWTMDEAFLQLFRKAELVHLAEDHQLEPPEGKAWAKLKASDLKAEILARGDQVKRPALLQSLYEDREDPCRMHWHWDDDGDDEDLEEDAA